MTNVRFVYMTAPNRDEALRIGRALVEQRLAACINVLPGMTSVYWWEGAVDTSDEAVLIAKTTADRLDALVSAVSALHPYQCPCIVALPIEAGHPGYLEWVVRETHPPP